MIIVHVNIQIKRGHILLFKKATLENAKNSLKEQGIVKFDILQEEADSSRFVLIEGYRTHEDILRHKETTHYQKWRDTVKEMMALPRTSIRYKNIFPSSQNRVAKRVRFDYRHLK